MITDLSIAVSAYAVHMLKSLLAEWEVWTGQLIS